MAKKKSKVAGKRRRRRTPEEMITDLQGEIRRVRARAREREMRDSASFKAALAALRAIDEGMEAAAREDNAPLRHALADGRRAIASHLEKEGIDVPRVQMPRRRRPKG